MNQIHCKALAKAILKEDITLSHYLLFQLILDSATQPLPPSMGDISKELDICTAAATQTVERLIKRGLLSRQQHPQDRRSLLISMTPTSVAMMDRIHHAAESSPSNVEPIRPYQYRPLGPVSVNEQSFAG